MAASKAVVDLTQLAAKAAIDKIGTELIALDLSEQMVLSEVFLIITAQNVAQVDAIADGVERALSAIGQKPMRREGTAEWILLDYSDLVVHIQSQVLRQYYMLDHLWNDCPVIPLDAVEEFNAQARSAGK